MAAPIGNTNALGNEGGRPTKYKDEYAEQAYKLCLLGHTNEELAEFFDVSVSTIGEWIVAYFEFSDAVRRGKTIADAEVAEGLYKRGVGFQYDEVTYEKVASVMDGVEEDTDDIKLDIYKKKVVSKMVAPDTGAALNWLKNRQPKKWREKIEVEQKNYNYNSDSLTPEKIKEIRQNLNDSY